MPPDMKPAHEPQSVAWRTASQAWNFAESALLPVPWPAFLTHAASAPVATNITPATASAGSMMEKPLRMSCSSPIEVVSVAARMRCRDPADEAPRYRPIGESRHDELQCCASKSNRPSRGGWRARADVIDAPGNQSDAGGTRREWHASAKTKTATPSLPGI